MIRIFLEIACFVAFLLISHGYYIMHEQQFTSERPTIAGLVSLLYLTLTGYKVATPQFVAFVMLIYLLMLYMIIQHLSRNHIIDVRGKDSICIVIQSLPKLRSALVKAEEHLNKFPKNKTNAVSDRTFDAESLLSNSVMSDLTSAWI